MLYTSYFEFVRNVPSEFLVSVAGVAPDGFRGREYKKLAPKYSWWKEWRNNNLSDEWCANMYRKTVLQQLDPAMVIGEIGDNKIMVCWEPVDKFCHRHLITKWMNANGIDARELTIFDRHTFTR